MQPLRISATTVDQYLRIGGVDYSNPSELFTVEKFVAEIKQGWVPTKAKTFGTAFGAIITEPERKRGYRLENGNQIWFYAHPFNPMDPLHHVFTDEQVALGIELMANYRKTNGMFWEVKNELQFGDVTLVCKCDGLASNFIIENKTTHDLTWGKYEDSYQWRFYLLAWPVDFVRYHVFQFAKANKAGYRKFQRHETNEFAPYEGMYGDCAAAVSGLADLIYYHNLESYFQPYSKK